MGMSTASIAQSTQPTPPTLGGKGAGFQAPQPESLSGQKITFPNQNGQPMMGMPNQYSNTTGLGDNQQQQMPPPQMGKGKGA
jgi:hypothetical protein